MKLTLAILTLVLTIALPQLVAAQTTSADSLRRHAPTEQKSRDEVKGRITAIGATEMPGEYQWERKKSPRVAMFSSMLLPGLGQMYNGRKWKAAAFFGGFTWFMAVAWTDRKLSDQWLARRDASDPGSLEYKLADLQYQFYRDQALNFAWWAGAVWLINVLDAFVDAHLFDVRGVDPSVIQGTEQQYVGFSVDF